MARNSVRRQRKGKETMASKADVHALYQQAVQCVEAEIDFVDETFTKLRRRKARFLREDFCGTANAACEWVRRRRTNRAVAVDIDAGVQEWGRRHNVELLGRSAWRIELVNADVLDVDRGGMDIVLAMNFSYWILHTRTGMRRYFEKVRDALVEDGVFFLDAYGGYDAFREMRETTGNDGFTYVWDQARYDPITGRQRCHIHFRFPDGSRIKDAWTRSCTSGGCGRCPRSARSWRKRASVTSRCTGRGPTSRPAKGTASSRRPSTARRTPAGLPTSPP